MADKPVIVLEDIADKLEETMDCWEQFLNTATGEFAALSDGCYVDTDAELAEEIENSGDYIRLPNQHQIHEYAIMERFAEATTDVKKRERLFRALNGRKPYRHFKDALGEMGLDSAYYSFRARAFVDIAREWCEEHDIPYATRGKGR